MSTQSVFHKEQQIASVTAVCDWHNINVHTLLQNTYQKQPAINAYLGARYSRSGDGVVAIAQEITEKGVDASARLESIFQGYGHKSVGDMAELFLCIENVPMLTAMRAFNINPVLAGQERSTRFQNFEKPDYVKIPESIKVPKHLRDTYDELFSKQLADYRELLPVVQKAYSSYFSIDEADKSQLGALKARTFDTVRYFLPLGLKTSLGFIMSARNWSEYIARLKGSGYLIESELGVLIYELLVGTPNLLAEGYIPEADMLIRHTEANTSRQQSFSEIKEYLNRTITAVEKRKLVGNALDDILLNVSSSPDLQLLEHYLLQMFPQIDFSRVNYAVVDFRKIGQILAKYHNHHDQLGNVGQTGSYQFDGYADHGILKDLNRHRSLERYVPLWDQTFDLSEEFSRSVAPFLVCDYLQIPELHEIREQFTSRLSSTYEQIIAWYAQMRNEVDEAVASEFCKYLLPHAHATRYRFYGSFDDIQYTANLRTRPGGHIAYRALTYRWLELLAKQSPLWEGFFEKVPKVDPASREQFVDRS